LYLVFYFPNFDTFDFNKQDRKQSYFSLHYVLIIRLVTLKITVMSKGLDSKKSEKKEPTKTLKEKRLEKKAKKEKK